MTVVNPSGLTGPVLVGLSAGAPAFQNGFGNFGGGFARVHFWQDSDGTVHVGGAVGGGVGGTAAFTLPVGMRPAAHVAYNTASGATDVLATGNVVPAVAAQNFDGVCFLAGAG